MRNSLVVSHYVYGVLLRAALEWPVDGTAELARLAELLRIGADVVRKIADVRPLDADELRRLCDEAERMAAGLEGMVQRGAAPGASSAGKMQ